ncbi:MAG: DUF2971 domain-containing protein [Chloroflexi bacterium]|nr:DUF2971 domain-containing protein [Chloroflexota bacterium]
MTDFPSLLYGRESKISSSLTNKEVRFLEDMEKDFEDINTQLNQSFDGIYVCSFSEEGNQLSQWRGYCPEMGGFSLGFNFDSSLIELISTQDFRLAKCVYDFELQETKVLEYLRDVLDFHNKETDFMNISSKAWDGFLAMAPLLKHPKFSEEKEWRLISKPRTIFGAQFRTGKSMLIPYVTINLSGNNTGDSDMKRPIKCFSDVFVGPTPNPDLSIISVENLLRVERVFPRVDSDGRPLTKCLVLDSEIPYRAW